MTSGTFSYILSLLCLVLPALWYGPLLPFLDTIGFVGLNSYPASESYGPLHYYIFEFTYFLPHVLIRAMSDFGVSPQPQVLICYVLQAALFVAGLLGILRSCIPHPEARSLAAVGGTLAFWDAMFLWGGPLAFSLAAALWTVSLSLSIEDAEREYSRPLQFGLLGAAALISHPFAVFFVLPLAALRFVLVRSRRLASFSVFVVLSAYSLLILRDNPEAGAAGGLSALFTLHVFSLRKFTGLFSWNDELIPQLFGLKPFVLSWLLRAYAGIRLAGFLGTPVLLWLHRGKRSHIMLLCINASAFLMFLFASDAGLITLWPFRILTFTNIVTFACGAFVLWELALWLSGRFRIRLETQALLRVARLAALIMVPMILVMAQVPVLAMGPLLRNAFERVRASVLSGPLDNSFLTVSGLEHLHPFYFRSLQFLLFSDPETVRRKALIYTEWHSLPRHNSRIVEATVRTGRPRKVLEFFMDAAGPNGRIVENRFTGCARLRVRFGTGIPPSEPGVPILTTGSTDNGNFLYVLSPRPGAIRLGLNRWGYPSTYSEPLFVDPSRVYEVQISYGADALKVAIDGLEVFTSNEQMRAVESPTPGKNMIGGTASLPAFPDLLEDSGACR